MLQSELHGEQQPEETERVPDNYPYRLPPLSGRKEHTQSIVGNQKGCGYDSTLLIQPFNSSLIANVETVEKVYGTFTSFLHLGKLKPVLHMNSSLIVLLINGLLFQ